MTLLAVFDTVSASNNGAKLQLKHPKTGALVFADAENTKPIVIRLKGQDSDDYQRASRKKLIEMRANKEDSTVINEATFDKTDTENINLFASLTIGWENIVHDGQELPFSKANATLVYTKYLEIKNQVAEFVAEKANFIKG